MKTVSVILASYNGEKYIKEQIDSILAQTYPIYEILIGDDGSADNTMSILNDYACKYGNIKIISSNGKHGVNYNFKRLMDTASGNYIAISDQDDIWFPEKIEIMIREIGTHVLVYSDAIPFSGMLTSYYNKEQSVEFDSYIPENSIEDIMFNNVVSGHRMLVKKEFINEIHEWNFDVYYDWWLAISASYRNSIIYIPCPLVFWRRHDHSMTLLSPKREKKIFKVFKFIRRRHSYFQSLLKLFNDLGIENEKQLIIYKLAHKFASRSVCINLYGCFYYCIKIKSRLSYSTFIKPLKMWSK